MRRRGLWVGPPHDPADDALCPEERLGRRLAHGDFNPAVRVNEPSSLDSDRLVDRWRRLGVWQRGTPSL